MSLQTMQCIQQMLSFSHSPLFLCFSIDYISKHSNNKSGCWLSVNVITCKVWIDHTVENIHIILYSAQVPCERNLRVQVPMRECKIQTARDTHMYASPLRVRERVAWCTRAASDAAAGHESLCLQLAPSMAVLIYTYF